MTLLEIMCSCILCDCYALIIVVNNVLNVLLCTVYDALQRYVLLLTSLGTMLYNKCNVMGAISDSEITVICASRITVWIPDLHYK